MSNVMREHGKNENVGMKLKGKKKTFVYVKEVLLEF